MSNEKKDEPLASSLVEDLDQSDQITSLVNEETDEDSSSVSDEPVETRMVKFIELFDKMESEGIDLAGPEAVSIARSATSELGIKQRVNNLADLTVEDLSEYEMKRIITRARSAIKRVIELRTKFAPIVKTIKKEDGTKEKVQTGGIAGPFYSNRRMKRQQNKKSGLRASQRSCIASKVVKREQPAPGI